MTESKLAFIVNPNAGSGKGKAYGELLEADARQRGLDSTFYYTSACGDATRLARTAADTAEIIIAVGGDGTVNEVLNGIWDLPIRFGVIPCGTGNDFIKMLRMDPANPLNALDQLFRYQVKPVDVGMVETNTEKRYFVNNIGIGFDALVAARANRIKYLGKFSYVLSVMTTLVTYREPTIRLSANGTDMHFPLFLMTFGNGTHAGGIFHLTPEALIDDGLFHATIISDVRKNRVFNIFPKVIKGTHLGEPEVKRLLTADGKIWSPEDLTIHADGEIITRHAREISVGILEKHLKVISGH